MLGPIEISCGLKFLKKMETNSSFTTKRVLKTHLAEAGVGGGILVMGVGGGDR